MATSYDFKALMNTPPMLLVEASSELFHTSKRMRKIFWEIIERDLKPTKHILLNFHLSFKKSFVEPRNSIQYTYDLRKLFQEAFTKFLKSLDEQTKINHLKQVEMRLEYALQRAYQRDWLFVTSDWHSRVLIDDRKVVPNNTFAETIDLIDMTEYVITLFHIGVVEGRD